MNLLQPQERRSREPGDSAAAVASRRRFADSGLGAPLTRSIAELLPCSAGDAVLDVGCGEGEFLGELTRLRAVDGYGVDLSTPAIELAARRYPHCRWIVANADRFVPLPDESLRAVTSITARLARDEFARILAPEGVLLVAVAAPDDLVELREIVLGARMERDRVERTRDLFAPVFELAHHERLRHRAVLDREAMADVMSSSYRGLRHRERERLEHLEPMEVTLSRDVLVFRKVWQ